MDVFRNQKKELCFASKGVAGVSAWVNASELEVGFSLENVCAEGDVYTTKYNGALLQAEVNVKVFETALRQSTKFIANEPCTLTKAPSANVQGICYDEKLASRLGDGSILVHYCISRWQGEGQWRTATPEDLGIYAATCHDGERSWCRFQSISSFSTATYFPILLIEDKKSQTTWFFTVECGRSWFIELYAYGGAEKMTSLSVKLGGADEALGFYKPMQVGEEYRSADCAYGVVDGGFEEGIQALVRYQRESSLVVGGSPLVFNDYMNCNWANESDKTLIPLIDKAAEMGCEIFCLDDGWQEEQGVWYPANSKFGDEGLQGIFSRIQIHGMRVGVWFEFETIPLHMQTTLGEDVFLFRGGNMVAPHRPLANFRSKKLVGYLNERVDALYQMGVRFIKNDHNNTEYLGATIYGESPAEGLERNEEAFLAFIDGLRAKYPDLILENCASGGMRSDTGTLRHFHIQSTSDQEDYLNYPSILAGSLALMPPEKAGIWCYPYPLLYDDRLHLELSKEQIASFADGEQTVCNVVSGCMGNLYLSGKIHQMDEWNTKLLKEGLEWYKSNREKISHSVPVFPCGMVRMSARKPYAVGLLCDKEILLAVWNLSDEAAEIAIDLKKYQVSSCSRTYPLEMEGVNHTYADGILRVKFSKGKTARLFSLQL